MRITYGPWGETLDELAAAARAAEDAGAEVLWVPELHRSATVSAAVLAQATSRARIGTSIAPAFTRSPMTTALEALDLDELSGGRFILGLGSGVRRLNEDWHGVAWDKPVARLRETVECIRYFVANCRDDAPMVVDGEYASLRVRGYQRPFPIVREEIPVYLAAVGPAMTRMAGRVADGWISHELCSPAYLRERLLPGLEEGLAGAGRDRKDLDVVVSACCSIDERPERAYRRAAGLVGFYASVRTYADFFDYHGLAAEQARIVEVFRAGTSADALAEAVPDPMVDALTLSGTPDQVRERLAGYAGLADTVKLTPPTHGLPAEETRRAQEHIIELIGALA
ncbi:LLM class flavin-dependent oxidoreductase [Actinomadura sp. BRA 177]|uniref:LLM class flavin-dependent oxidoreductase n=1 Tax=Actinomadura sp. BRA 177 TaxID=2745202 RepID=UPI0015952E8D|nr:LLM class flavin-dependent oxidoreductase [Actinomadura sp. BRA 177]NVI92762.1 LLM class flavin-dependent oxidoreductase [Actinomadura sp. BRA 177]